MPRRPRGAYIGGHTVIGPGSGWFSKSKPKIKAKKPKPLGSQEVAKPQKAKEEECRQAEEQRRRAKEEKRERQRKAEEAAFEAKIKQEVKAAARRLQLEAKMAKVLVVKQRLGSRPGPRKRVGVAHTSRRAFKAAVRVPSSR